MAKKPRLSTSVDPELKAEAESKAEGLKMSSSEFLEMCLRDGLGHFNVYQENKHLKEKKACLEAEARTLIDKRDRAWRQKSVIAKEREKIRGQRDDFENQLHDETTAYNKCYERAESLKKERDKFKEKYGQAQTAYEKSDAQVKAYQQQGIWGRLFGLKPRSMLIF